MKDSTMKKRPPKSLSPEAKSWWNRIVQEFQIDDEAGYLLLQTGLEALDELRMAQDILKTEGLTIKDRFGQAKPHPLLPILRDSRTAMMRALKALNLDIVVPTEQK